jgi:DNA repair exonuclease SbcCD ATPase subunit
MNLVSVRGLASQLLTEYDQAQRTLTVEAAKLQSTSRTVKCSLGAQKIIQHVAHTVQKKAHDRIATVVSRCLTAVFQEQAYEFVIRFEKKRGKTEAVLAFVRNGREFDPATESGGGVVDVASFALKLVCLILRTPKLRRVMILDEAFKHLSEQYRDRVRELLAVLAREMNVQIIQVTHSDQLIAGKIIEIG